MPDIYTSQILDSALFIAGESSAGSSSYEGKVLDYANRAYRSIANGGLEYSPEIDERWLWLKSQYPGTITLEPAITVGTVSVEEGSTDITFSTNLSESVVGWFFKTSTHSDIFRVIEHIAGESGAVLDSVYTGNTNSAMAYRLMKLEYDLNESLMELLAPLRAYKDGIFKIQIVDESTLDKMHPLLHVGSGMPNMCARVDQNSLRFNKYLRSDSNKVRIDYAYLVTPTDLTDSPTEEPLIPKRFRHVLTDFIASLILADKEDTNAAVIGARAQAGLAAMAKDNQREWARMAEDRGRILYRNNNFGRGLVRTESGYIISES